MSGFCVKLHKTSELSLAFFWPYFENVVILSPKCKTTHIDLRWQARKNRIKLAYE